MKRTLLLVVTVFLLLVTGAASQASLRISPEMELLAGVLSQTTWMNDRGPSGDGNEYFQALKVFFAEHKDHRAVRLAQDLTKKGFTYDAPPAFICHLGPLPDLELVHEHDQLDLFQEANSRWQDRFFGKFMF